ncbi:MAG TPA: DegT/DnrJ/EryC1/StrS family aminotransferase [Syntrophorhabdaceae bacterium]|nr:DegT/DnrJ/EryC1/StrS family aminotransferase [Syntrophorhabdaceae bacterium]
MKVKFFNYPLQFDVHKDEYMDIVQNTFARGAYILGDDLQAFERNLAQFVGSKYAVGVGNCTDALLLSAIAAGIGPGDEVISVSHTFVATLEVVKFLGAVPVLVDIASDHNMDVDLVEASFTPRTKAVLPVSLNGRVCDNIDKLERIAGEHEIVIIEDAAQSLGARYKNRGAGTFGLMGCFSFYPAKLLGTFGDAGAIVTDDEECARRLRMLRNHGKDEATDIKRWGLNCRMDNMHAAILNYKLNMLSDLIKRRREIAAIYDKELSQINELKLPPRPIENGIHYDVYQNYEIEAQNRDNLVAFLKKKGIEVSIPWGGKAVHQFSALRLSHGPLPHTEDLFQKVVMLPLYPELKNEEIEYVIEAIKDFYNEK